MILSASRARAVAKCNAHGSGLIQHIQNAETQAHRDGFHVTAHALNRAKNALGWEMQGEIEEAGKASRRR